MWWCQRRDYVSREGALVFSLMFTSRHVTSHHVTSRDGMELINPSIANVLVFYYRLYKKNVYGNG